MQINMELYVHIGLCKTGTTTLQKQIFPKLRNIKFYGGNDTLEYFYDVMFTDDLYYDEQRHFNFFNSAVENNSILYSQESLTGFTDFLGFSYRSKVAHRLKKIGFKKIIITVRNQKSVIQSAYRQYIKNGGVLTFRKFFQNDNIIVENYFDLKQFEYWKLIHLYVRLFGKENVCILPLELLVQNKNAYLKKIENFLDDVFDASVSLSTIVNNKGMSNFSLSIMRILNHFTYSYYKPSNLISNKISSYKVQKLLSKTIDPLVFGFSHKRNSLLTENDEKIIMQYYKESNQQLNRFYNLNLGKYNYPL